MPTTPTPPTFTVDTHLFRELGDLLVGRDSTALFELIKNSYDADASNVTVEGTNLGNPRTGQIVITDNGCGMNEAAMRKGFLRVASRLKDIGDRRSKKYLRRFTGAKGIGRLAAHKLARILEIASFAGTPGRKTRESILATIDWDAIEALETIDQIEEGKQVTVEAETSDDPLPSGTKIVLRKLRRAWTPEERELFVAECQSFRPPRELTRSLVNEQLTKKLLFDKPSVREQHEDDPGCTLELKGDFLTGDSLWPNIAKTSEWVIEIDASGPDGTAGGRIKYGFAPTKRAVAENPSWERRTFSTPNPRSKEGPFFQARVLVQIDPKATPADRRRIRNESGLRVFVEGFRVLPYGEPGNDWLSLDADYARRSSLDFGETAKIFGPAEDDEWENLSLPNRSYFGGVFFTQDGAAKLRALVNREGFLPNDAFLFVRTTVRQAIDLCTRVRAAATLREREAAREARRRRREKTASEAETEEDDDATESDETAPPSEPEPFQQTVSNVTSILQEARDLLANANIDGAEDLLAKMPNATETLSDSAERIAEEGPIIRVLASVGTQMSAFVHEIRSLLATARAVEEAFDRLLNGKLRISEDALRQLRVIRHALGELRRHLERQASYLLDIVTPDASRRRSRQKLSERFEAGAKLFRSVAERRKITIENDIPPNLKTPPMFPAELTTIFSNLLSNAIKAAHADGGILATGREAKGRVIIRLQNTGEAVDLHGVERWFRPFESSTTEVDADLGQGMGLGLTITRNMLEPYGATIHFVEPSRGYSTALEIIFPE